MDEGKVASNALSDPNESNQDSAEDDAVNMKGRFRNPDSAQLGLDADLDDDEAAISKMAKRFRGPGAKLSEAKDAPSLDSEDRGVEDDELSDDELQNFMLDALDDADQADDYELEEVDQPGPSARTTDPAPGSTDMGTASVDATDRMIDPPSHNPVDADGPAGAGVTCQSCHATNPPGMRFCVQCGGSLADPDTNTPAQGPADAQAPREPPPPSAAAQQTNPWDIHLVSINEDGSDGISIGLEYLETTLGRDGDTRFPTDAFLSPKHARLHIDDDGQVFLEDLYSINGTFLKLRDEVLLTPGDSFLMGRQVLRFERFDQSITPKTRASDGTRYMGSPTPGGDYKLLQIGIGNLVQNVYCLPESGAVLGREKGDIIFPHDKFMSSRHAQIYTGEDGQCYLVDLNSSNGTWSKIWEKTALTQGDYIFMGQQLFRVHIGQDA